MTELQLGNVIDFNDVVTRQTDLIPEGTIVKVRMSIRHGGYGQDGILTKSRKTGTLYCDAMLIVSEGIFVTRKIFERLGVQDPDPYNKWVQKSLQRLRSILESTHNIMPTDTSEHAKEKRRIKSYADFNGLEFLIKVGIEKPQNPQYKTENCVLGIVTPDWKEYTEYSAQIDSPPKTQFQGNPYKPFDEKVSGPF
ncbi:hypothetical protein AGMMS49949_09360 [Alphaproteobacteria bacterium]|nr:hypothetical protein AGMMS49949_09360 [Alphaproteobacteria bacterium]GHT00801.1 hypothetical protein AGMMS50296_9100 [Alphaproteobacteria bacterium]